MREHVSTELAEGLIPWFEWGHFESGAQLHNHTEVVFRVECSMGGGDEGIILHSGGSKGWVLYIYAGLLSLAQGMAGGVLSEISFPISGSPEIYIIEGWLRANPGYMELVVDGVNAGSATWTGLTQLSGTGSIGGASHNHGGVTENRGGWVLGDSGDYTGTVYAATMYDRVLPLFSWVPMVAYNDISHVNLLGFRVVASFGPATSGVLWEYGGTGEGAILYMYSGALYFQCGVGNNGYGQADNNSTAEVSMPITTFDKRIIQVYASCDEGVVRLYSNGLLVDSATLSHTKLVGNNAGAAGRTESFVCNNRAGFNPSTQEASAFTGEIHGNLYFTHYGIPISATPSIPNYTLEATLEDGDTFNPPGTSLAISIECTITNTDTGIIMEIGNGGAGVVIYVLGSVLYCRFGSHEPDSSFELSERLVTGTHDYFVEFDGAPNSTCTLWVGGNSKSVVVNTNIMPNDNAAGKLGGPNGATLPLRVESPGNFTGTITEAKLYDNT